MSEDRRLDGTQLRAGLQTQLGHQLRAALAIRRQRVRLAAGGVEGEHQLPAQVLAQRVAGDERLELGHEPRAVAELEFELQPRLGHREAKLLESLHLDAGERLELDAPERRPAPQGQRFAVGGGGDLRGLVAGTVGQPLEHRQVESAMHSIAGARRSSASAPSVLRRRET